MNHSGVLHGQKMADPVLMRIRLNIVMRHWAPRGNRPAMAAIGQEVQLATDSQ